MTVVITDLHPFISFLNSLEKLIYNRLIHFISKHDILTDAEHGFRDNKSTEMASYIFLENIQESMDKQLYVLGLILTSLRL